MLSEILACLIHGVDPNTYEFHKGAAEVLDDPRHADYGLFQKMAANFAANAYECAGYAGCVEHLLFDSLRKQATWYPELDRFTDPVLRVLTREYGAALDHEDGLAYQDKSAGIQSLVMGLLGDEFSKQAAAAFYGGGRVPSPDSPRAENFQATLGPMTPNTSFRAEPNGEVSRMESGGKPGLFTQGVRPVTGPATKWEPQGTQSGWDLLDQNNSNLSKNWTPNKDLRVMPSAGMLQNKTAGVVGSIMGLLGRGAAATPQVAKMMLGTGAVTGAGLGALAWGLNRDSTEDELKTEAMRERLRHYRKITNEISQDLNRNNALEVPEAPHKLIEEDAGTTHVV